MNHPIQPNPTPPVAVDPAPRISATPQPHPAPKRQRRDDSNQQYVQIRAGIFRNVSHKMFRTNLHNLKSSLSMFIVDCSNMSTDSSSLSLCSITVSLHSLMFLISQMSRYIILTLPVLLFLFFSFFIIFFLILSPVMPQKNSIRNRCAVPESWANDPTKTFRRATSSASQN